MSRRPTRATPGGRAYLGLRKLARERGRPTSELLQLYALEGFLVRLPLSDRAQRFVLKGGILLAAFDARRPGAPELPELRTPIHCSTLPSSSADSPSAALERRGGPAIWIPHSEVGSSGAGVSFDYGCGRRRSNAI